MGRSSNLSGQRAPFRVRDDRSQTAHLVQIDEIPVCATTEFVGSSNAVLGVHIVDRDQGCLIIFLHFVVILIERLVMLAEIRAMAERSLRSQCCCLLPQILNLLEAS